MNRRDKVVVEAGTDERAITPELSQSFRQRMTQLSHVETSLHDIARPPAPFKVRGKSVFLAGSMVPDWQSKLTSLVLARLPDKHITILDPRRRDWDSTWKESVHFPLFKEQVEWELHAQEVAIVIAMYFNPETKAPVSLLELGLNARSGKLVVCCPEGYWKKGNVDVVCAKFGIKVYGDFEGFEEEVLRRLMG